MSIVSIDEITLASGSHSTRESGMCAMEAAAYLAGEPHSDSPQCVCPVIAALIRTWNDNLPDNLRQTLLKPLIPSVIGTRADADTQDRRAILVAVWTQRVVLPLWLDLAGLVDAAAALRSLPEASTVDQLAEVSRAAIVDSAKNRAAAAQAAAWAAAGDVARTAAGDAAGDAARDAAWAAAGAVAQDAAWAAAQAVARTAAGAVARTAAGAAAQAALKPTVLAIWNTYPALIQRLI